MTSIGECINYDPGKTCTLPRLFTRVFIALRPGGVFLFDAAEPSRMPAGGSRRLWNEGSGWAVLVETEGDPTREMLTRRIVSFRRIGPMYRRTVEVHRLRLYRRQDVLRNLERAGFHARPVDRFGPFRLPAGICGFVAVKPG